MYNWLKSLFVSRMITICVMLLVPLPLLNYANRLGNAWLEDWNRADADRQRLPYALLRVNAITIGVHFSTGMLLVLAYSLRGLV